MDRSDEGGSARRELPVHVRQTELADGMREDRASVQCPLENATVDAAQCPQCPHFIQVVMAPGAAAIWCHGAAPEASAESGDLASLLRHIPVSRVMTADARCVASDLSLTEAARFFEEKQLRWAPVVDDDGALVGVLSTSNLVSGHGRKHPAPTADDAVLGDFVNRLGALVEDVMTGEATFVREESSLAEALVLLARDRVHRVPVVNGRSQVVGVLSALDLQGFIARQLEQEQRSGPRKA